MRKSKKSSRKRPDSAEVDPHGARPRSGDADHSAADPVYVCKALIQAEKDNGSIDDRGRFHAMPQNKVAEMIGMSSQSYGAYRTRGEKGRGPTFALGLKLARVLELSIEELIDSDTPNFLHERNGISWRLASVPRNANAKALRIAAALLLGGRSVDEIAERVQAVLAARNIRSLQPTEARLRDMVQGGLSLNLVEIELSEAGREIEDRKLAGELAAALEADSPSRHRPTVRVVRNVAHESFKFDPVAPFLVARVAHGLVEKHIAEQETIYTTGLAGGVHCATFVHSIGAASSPFPDDSGDKRLTFVPLTLEPFLNHKLPMADAVVAQMASKGRSLLGSKRIEALTFQGFGYATDNRVEPPSTKGIVMVREGYLDLDVAIYGCGDPVDDGWLSEVMRHVGIDPAATPATDVCLNLLTADGQPIHLPDRRQFVGVSLSDIQRLVVHEGKLALLLTSGRAKGEPITVVSRAGCADTIVCDQAAARSALEVLSGRS